jgi:ankyrin repeat protein
VDDDDCVWEDPYPLHTAAQSGDAALVQELLGKGVPPSDFDDLGMTPLHYAAKEGHLPVMDLLLRAGAEVDAHDERTIGNTPLGDVAGDCSYEVAERLIAAGADPTVKGWMQLSALDGARKRKRPGGVRVRELLEAAAEKRRR